MLAVARKLHPTWFHESHLEAMPIDFRYQQGFVAVDADKIVGYISCLSDDGVPRIDSMGVQPELRRRGIGRKLVAALERDVRKAGAGTLQVTAMGWTLPFNRPPSETLKFYKALGFKVVQKHPVNEEGRDRWRLYTLEKRLV